MTRSISIMNSTQLMAELKRLEEAFPEFITPDSPTQRIGERPVEGFPTIAHRWPCSASKLLWIDRVARIRRKESKNFCPVKKLNMGWTEKRWSQYESIRYNGGKYQQAVTRVMVSGWWCYCPGQTIRSLPLTISLTEDVEVRGEVYLPYESFKKIQWGKRKKRRASFANPRYATAGSIRLLDPREVARRRLDIFLYYIFINSQEMPPNGKIYSNLRNLTSR
jgi:DNA ligase (NAD+)